MKRKVIQISQAGASNGYTIVALCDDGTLWYCDHTASTMAWKQMPDVPQPDSEFVPATREDVVRVVMHAFRSWWGERNGISVHCPDDDFEMTLRAVLQPKPHPTTEGPFS